MSKMLNSISVVLSWAMFYVVGYNYSSMKYFTEFQGASAPAEVAFIYFIPFVAAIIVCLSLSFIIKKKFE